MLFTFPICPSLNNNCKIKKWVDSHLSLHHFLNIVTPISGCANLLHFIRTNDMNKDTLANNICEYFPNSYNSTQLQKPILNESWDIWRVFVFTSLSCKHTLNRFSPVGASGSSYARLILTTNEEGGTEEQTISFCLLCLWIKSVKLHN